MPVPQTLAGLEHADDACSGDHDTTRVQVAMTASNLIAMGGRKANLVLRTFVPQMLGQ